jgi:hypothetical protein
MKKLLFISFFTAASFFFSGTGMAQNVVKVNIFSPLVRTGSLFYERALSENKSLQLGVFFTGMKLDNTRFSGYGITPEFRYYLSSTDAPKGVYLGSYLRFQSFSLKDETSSAKGTHTSLGGGLLIGRQWIFKDKISLDAFIGPGYNGGKTEVESGENQEFETGAISGFTVRPGLTLGYKF